MNTSVTHPDFHIVEQSVPDDIREIAYAPVNFGPANSPAGPPSSEIFNIFTQRNRNRVFLTIILPDIFMSPRPLSLLEAPPPKSFPFEKLPNSIQARIFKFVFVNPTLVHCISRLDKSEPPLNFVSDRRRTGLLHRFHTGTGSCCIPLARKPNNVLRALLVSKRWLFIGAHAFYGINTFAFSSLGELGKFCNGIGRARVERLQHIELMWHGNLMHTRIQLMPQENGKERVHKVSRRTWPLRWLTRTRRLRTLLVHIDESDATRVRRSYEMRCDSDWEKDEHFENSTVHTLGTFGQMTKRTACQPNFRKYRSLRTVHGMDYVYQLRGMKW